MICDMVKNTIYSTLCFHRRAHEGQAFVFLLSLCFSNATRILFPLNLLLKYHFSPWSDNYSPSHPSTFLPILLRYGTF